MAPAAVKYGVENKMGKDLPDEAYGATVAVGGALSEGRDAKSRSVAVSTSWTRYRTRFMADDEHVRRLLVEGSSAEAVTVAQNEPSQPSAHPYPRNHAVRGQFLRFLNRVARASRTGCPSTWTCATPTATSARAEPRCTSPSSRRSRVGDEGLRGAGNVSQYVKLGLRHAVDNADA